MRRHTFTAPPAWVIPAHSGSRNLLTSLGLNFIIWYSIKCRCDGVWAFILNCEQLDFQIPARQTLKFTTVPENEQTRCGRGITNERAKEKFHCFLSFSSFEKEVGTQKVPKFIFFLYHVETTPLSLNSIFLQMAVCSKFSDWFQVSANSICWTNFGGGVAEKNRKHKLVCLKCIIYLSNCVTSNRGRRYFPVFFYVWIRSLMKSCS